MRALLRNPVGMEHGAPILFLRADHMRLPLAVPIPAAIYGNARLILSAGAAIPMR
jgi:hypothetical protein